MQETTPRDPCWLIQRSDLELILHANGVKGDTLKNITDQVMFSSSLNHRKYNLKRSQARVKKTIEQGNVGYTKEALKSVCTHAGIAILSGYADAVNPTKIQQVRSLAANIGILFRNHNIPETPQNYRDYITVAVKEYNIHSLTVLHSRRAEVDMGYTAYYKTKNLSPEDETGYTELVNLWIELNNERTNLGEEALKKIAERPQERAHFLEALNFIRKHDASVKAWMECQFEGFNEVIDLDNRIVQAQWLYNASSLIRYHNLR